MDLKKLWARAGGRVNMASQDFEQMSLKELGNLEMTSGRQKGKLYKNIFEDRSYNDWVVAHTKNLDQASSHMKGYVIYLQRRLIQEQGLEGKEDLLPQSTPMKTEKGYKNSKSEPSERTRATIRRRTTR